MKVLHTISGIDRKAGGPSKSISDLSYELAKNNLDISIITYSSPNPYIVKSTQYNLKLHFVNDGRFKKELNNLVSKNNFDILHGHGIWQMPVHYMASLAREIHKPYVISPRGMLRPWALEQGSLKKKIALKLYQNKDLSEAACLHSTAKIEADEIRLLGFKNPIAVIPNGIDLKEYSIRKEKIQNSKKTILYLSRVFPKKGIENLIEAWSMIAKEDRKDWQIKIAGNGNERYIHQLKKLISESTLENEIKFIGPKYGQDKIDTYYQADLFVLPTLGENFGMVVAEALACGVPVITTKGAPWEVLNTNNAGWWIDIGVEPLAKALTEAMQLSDSERIQMGLNGRKLVEENYSIESVAKKMIQLYEWILYKKEKPEFVYL